MGLLPEAELAGDDRFEVLGRIGAGGMGVVYRVFDRERGGVVALKTLRSMGPSAIARVKQEFRALADVRHPNLVTLHELVQRGDRCFFTMELVDGCNFLDWVRPSDDGLDGTQATTTIAGSTTIEQSGGGWSASPELQRSVGGTRLEVARLRASFAQLAAGVAALHAAGKLHRDIKPSNVLVTPDGRVAILDFGLVTELSRAAAMSDAIAGTTGYMAPEQGAGEALGEASDWYAAGVMLYEALTGCRPFFGRRREILAEQLLREPVPPGQIASGVPEDLAALSMQLLQRDPDRRPSGAAVLTALGMAAAGDSSSSRGEDAPLVGRDAELAALEAAFGQVVAGGTVVALVRGPSGIGKSRLVRSFLESLRGRALVREGRCHERESVPFNAVDSLMDALGGHLAALPRATADSYVPADVHALVRIFPTLWRVVEAQGAHGVDVPDVNELRRRAFAALRELLARVVARAPLVVFIDDLQWGDVDSAALLDALLAAPTPLPVLLIGCHRAHEPARRPVLRTLLAARRDVTAVDLPIGPLGPDEVRALADRLCRDAPAAAVIAREADGSPFFVQQLARLVRDGAASAIGDHRVDLDEMLRARLATVSAQARALLAVIALAAGPIPQAVATAAAGLAHGDLDQIEQLRAASLVRTDGARGRDAVECYHDRIREAAVRLVGADQRRDLHGRLARALEHDPTQAEALAEHYHEAGELAEAARWAVQAADRAAAALAFDRAAELYQRALAWRAVTGGDVTRAEVGDGAGAIVAGHAIVAADESRELWARLGDALVAAGRGVEAARAYLAAAPGAAPDVALARRHRAAEQLLHSGHIDEGSAELRAVLGAIGLRAPVTRFGAVMSLLASRVRIAVGRHRYRARRAGDVPGPDLLRTDVCWSAMTGFSLTSHLRATAFQARHAREALRTGEPGRLAIAFAGEAFFFAHDERGAGFAAHADRLAAEVGDPAVVATVMLFDGWRYIELGQWAAARDRLGGADQLLRERCSGNAWARDTAQVFRGIALGHLGQLAEQQRHVERILQDARARGDYYLASSVPFHLFLADLAGDDPDGLRAAVRAAVARGLPHEVGIQHWGVVQAEASASLYEGDARAALERVEAIWPALRRSLLLQSVAFRREALMVRGRALVGVLVAGDRRAGVGAARATAQIAARAAAHAAAIVRTLERDKTGATRAMGALLAACLAHARRDPDASARYDQAAAALDAHGMSVLAAAARWRRGELLGGADGTALIAGAHAVMVGEAVRRPERMVALLAPA